VAQLTRTPEAALAAALVAIELTWVVAAALTAAVAANVPLEPLVSAE